MEPLPYYKWHWRDYRANRRVQRMSWQAKGLYREMLDEFWAEGSLPLDHAELADICGCTAEEFENHWPEIKGCWEETQDGLANAKMDSMRTATDSTRVTNAKSGRAGAIAKLANAKPTLANAERTSGERHIAEQSRADERREEERTLASTAIAVPAARGKLVCTLPLNQGEHEVFHADVQEWEALYPAVDVRQELRSIKGWANSNPTRRKTKTGIGRFINSWMARSQNEAKPGGGNGNRNQSKTGGNVDAARQALAILAEAERVAGDADEMQPEAGSCGEPGDLGYLRTGSIELRE